MGRLANAWAAIRGRPQASADEGGLDLSAFMTVLANMGFRSKSGVNITVDKALGVTTVFAATRALAEGMSQMPIKVMLGDDTNKTVARDHPVHKVLAFKPNAWMTGFGFRETMMYHAVLTGNAFAVKIMAGNKLTALIPVTPGSVTIKRSALKLTYQVNDADGVIGTFDQSTLFHFRGPSWNSYSGLEVMRLAREAIGLSIATEENHALLHANGSKVEGVLSTPNALTDVQIARIGKLWNESRESKYGTAVLDNNFSYHRIGMTGVDAQHIQTREHQIKEICRAIGVFPMIIGEGDKTATFASAEAFFTAHVVLHLMPWVRRLEEAINTQLIGEEDFAKGFFCKMFPAGLMRGDARTRAAFYQIMVLTGIFTRNECRLLEDVNPLDGLDEPLVPLNMGGVNDDPAAGGAGPGGNQNTPGAGISVVPKSVADAMAARLIGHNGGPRLDDGLPGGRVAVGRALSAKNEKKIREASASIADADTKLVEVLSALDKEPIKEDSS